MSQQKEAKPSVGIIDTQSAKTTEYPSKRDYDAGKKINGKKRHIIVDINGLVLKACVHPANTQDRDGAKLLVDNVSQIIQLKYIFLKKYSIIS